MPAGPLRKRVTFEREMRTEDAGGGAAVAWGDPLTVWGQFQPERGAERLSSGRLESALAGVLRIRSSDAARQITADQRVTIDGIAHQIRSIANPDQRNRMIEMTVERGVAV
jgi:SPP1 family predicted phage head-tail adaptor